MNTKTDILNELKELSPVLFKLKVAEKPLSVPVRYFESFANQVIDEIKTETGLLATLQKEKTAVPADYFDTFADQMVAKLKKEEKAITDGKTINLPKQTNKVYQLFTRVALAASVIGAVFLIKYIEQPVLPINNCEDGIACLTQEEIYQYMNANSQDFDMQEIQETVQPIINSEETGIEIKTQEAEQYIDENKIILDIDDTSTDIF